MQRINDLIHDASLSFSSYPSPQVGSDAWAQTYIERGYSPTPVHPNNKQPIEAGWSTLKIAEGDIPVYFGNNPNIGLVLGAASNGLVDIDIDDPLALKIADYFLPPTDMITGRDSNQRSHRFYRVADAGDSRKFQAASNHGGVLVEYRANKCQTLVPPSLHPSGESIRFFADGQPAAVSRENLIEKVSHLAAAALLAKVWHSNSRHDMSLALAGGLARAGWTPQSVAHLIEGVCLAANDDEVADRKRAIHTTFERVNQGNPVTGWPSLADLAGEQLVSKVQEWLCAKHEVIAASAPTPAAVLQDNTLSDGWVMDRFVERAGRDIRYNAKRKVWMVWNGKFWEVDDKDQALKKLEEVVRDLRKEALSRSDRTERDQLTKFLLRCDSFPKLRDILALSRMHLAIDDDCFDADPYLLNVANGTLNLRTGTLQKFSREDFMSKASLVKYEPDATCPTFDAFMHQISVDRPEWVAYVLRALGYSLTGDTKEQAFFVLYGKGANGKSTLLNIVKRIQGPYAQQASIRTFTNQDRQQTNDLAEFRSARFISVSEAEQTHTFSEALIKQLTGSESLRARRLYENEIEFTPQCKFFVATNHLPVIKGTDHGIWRRVNLIPFDFKASSPDHDLPQKLWEEAPGILNRLIKGCIEWQGLGLNPPAVVADATNKYREDSDVVGLFLNDMCMEETGASVPKKDLYESFAKWCDEVGHDKIVQKLFGEALLSRGFREKRTTQTRYWRDLKLFTSSLGKDLADREA